VPQEALENGRTYPSCLLTSKRSECAKLLEVPQWIRVRIYPSSVPAFNVPIFNASSHLNFVVQRGSAALPAMRPIMWWRSTDIKQWRGRIHTVPHGPRRLHRRAKECNASSPCVLRVRRQGMHPDDAACRASRERIRCTPECKCEKKTTRWMWNPAERGVRSDELHYGKISVMWRVNF